MLLCRILNQEPQKFHKNENNPRKIVLLVGKAARIYFVLFIKEWKEKAQ